MDIQRIKLLVQLKFCCKIFFFLLILSLCEWRIGNAQTELMAWGNITGIRVEGQLMEFETSLMVAGKDWTATNETGRERQSPKYHRDGQTQVVKTEMSGIKFTEEVLDKGLGNAIIDISAEAVKDTLIDGVYFCLTLSGNNYSDVMVKLNGSSKGKPASAYISEGKKSMKFAVKSLIFESAKRKIELNFNNSSTVFFHSPGSSQGCK